MKTHKKAQAGNQLMIFPFLFLLIVIGTGIWLGISMFFGSEYDFRKIDATLLHNSIRSCISENNFDWSLPREELEKEFYKTCKINQEVVESYLGIEIKVNDEIKVKWLGDPTQCALADKNKNFPRCENSTTPLNEEEIKITAGSNQHSRVEIT
ncbi:MAG: hypothetical protein ABIG28_00245 [archaeon]